MQKFLDTLVELAVTSGVRLVGSILLVIIGFKLINVLVKRFKQSKGASRIDPSALSFLSSFASIALKVVIGITAAAIIGVPMTNMVAILGSAGLAVGLALQGSLSNLAGGLMILIFSPFHVGDYIEAGSVSGTVQSINIFYTRLLTVDNCRVSVPNGLLSNSTVVNCSVEPTRRIDLDFSVSYDSDHDTVRRLLTEIAAEHPQTLKEPAPVVLMTQHGDSAVVFQLRVWCSTANYWPTRFDILEKAKAAFDQNGISIPYPQMDVHVTQ